MSNKLILRIYFISVQIWFSCYSEFDHGTHH